MNIPVIIGGGLLGGVFALIAQPFCKMIGVNTWWAILISSIGIIGIFMLSIG